MFVKHKILTFKDEWNIYTDESESRALLRVKARQAIGLNIVTDVFDAQTGEKIGAVRNKGLKSIVRDTWEVLDTNDSVVGQFGEDSNALLRRFIPLAHGDWWQHRGQGGPGVPLLHQGVHPRHHRWATCGPAPGRGLRHAGADARAHA